MDQDIWQNILDKLEDNINQQSFRTWFSDTKLVDMMDDSLFIRVPTQFAANYLNQNYTETLGEISYALYKQHYKVKFISPPHFVNNGKKEPSEYSGNRVMVNTRMNERFSFEQFVVGRNNNFAYSAAKAVAEAPGYTYNPLFIYGESGMGKT
ncbi:MAG: DnaA ATPase domain-containing protein, partial [Candidatus Syntrophosphaera sp.]